MSSSRNTARRRRLRRPNTSPPPPAPAPQHQPAAAAPQTAHEWSLMTVAGLTVWAEDAIKQIGPERLRILLDLCEFTGYLSTAAKEALLSVTSLVPAAEKRHRRHRSTNASSSSTSSTP